ncbi:MAG: hypothetical protein U0324_00215 [Polyangiales bacterium]
MGTANHSYPPSQGPYRAPRLAAPSPPRPRWPAALAVTALVAGAAAVALVPRRRAPPRPAVPGDAGTFGAPVLHASRLIGDSFACALTRVRGGRSQVVCDAARTVTARGETREVPRAWYTDELTAVFPASDRRDRTAWGTWNSEALHHRAGVIATGRRRDGQWLSFRNDDATGQAVDLPSLGARGALVELRYAAETMHGGNCGMDWRPASSWVARAADGALLALPDEYGGAHLEWRTVLERHADVRAVALDGLAYCAIARGSEVLCGWLPWTDELETLAPVRASILAQPGLVEVALRDGVVCARGGAGVRCQTAFRRPAREVAVRAPGFEGAATAMAFGVSDLCIADARGRWWCDETSDRGGSPPPRFVFDDGRDLDRARSLAHASALDGAVEVAFADTTGCARWPSGAVRCWGQRARGRHVWVREAATEITSLRGATSLDVDGGTVCAVRDGHLWCAGSEVRSPEGWRRPSPVEVRLPWVARAVALDGGVACVAGEGVWCGGVTTADVSPHPRAVRFPARGAVRSFRRFAHGLCAVTERGEAWCRSQRAPEVDFVRVNALEGGERLVEQNEAVCAIRAGVIVGCHSDLDWRELPPSGSRHTPDVQTFPTGVPAALGEVVESAGFGGCVRGATGRVACPTATAYEIVPGVERARVVRGRREFGCALTEAGAVLCWGSNEAGLLTADEAARGPRLIPLAR